MLFLGQQAVLIEVGKNQSQQYLIGTDVFENLPSRITHKILTTANWNRALRFFVAKKSGFQNQGFFLLRFEIYLKNGVVLCFAKNSFEQKILDQEKFQTEFLPVIFAFRNRNLQFFPLKTFPHDDDLEIVPDLKIDLNRCWVNNTFPWQSYKYQVLFKPGETFRVEKTKFGQTIYYSNFDFQDWDLVDLKTGSFFQTGKYQLNVEVCLTLTRENQSWKNQFLNQLVKFIQEEEKIKESHKNWHLFNITGNIHYLVNALDLIFQKESFNAGLNVLENIFKELNYSYYFLLFSHPETKKVFVDFASDQTESEKLKFLLQRYG